MIGNAGSSESGTRKSKKQRAEEIQTMVANVAVGVSELLIALFVQDEGPVITVPAVVKTPPSAAPTPAPTATPRPPAPAARKPGREYKAAVMPKPQDVIQWQGRSYVVTSVAGTNFNARQKGEKGRPCQFSWVLPKAPVAAAPTPVVA